jgi:hypothetical protein
MFLEHFHVSGTRVHMYAYAYIIYMYVCIFQDKIPILHVSFISVVILLFSVNVSHFAELISFLLMHLLSYSCIFNSSLCLEHFSLYVTAIYAGMFQRFAILID